MQLRSTMVVWSFLLGAFLSACGGGSGDGGAVSSSDDGGGLPPVVVDTVAPYVLSTNPVLNSIGVEINRAITVTFNEAIDPATITSNSFLLDHSTGGIVTGTVTYDAASRTAIFLSDVNLATSTAYIATITNDVKDLAGNALSNDYTWGFTTAAPPDIDAIDASPPNVMSRFPAPNAISVAPNTVISVTFNEPIDPFTINTSTLTLHGASPVSGTISYIGTTALFKPEVDLTAGTVYTVTVAGTIKDLAGNFLGAPEVWSFTTGSQADVQSPQVLSFSPLDDAENVPTDSSVVVNFNEPIKPFEYGVIDGRPVAVTFNETYTSISMKPTADLKPNTTYTVSIQIQDQAGNLMEQPYTWQFKTAL